MIDDHDHDHDHDHELADANSDQPMAFRDAVSRLIELDTIIRKAAEAGKTEDGHDALHEIGMLLETLPASATNAEPPLDIDAVTQSSNTLFDSFSRIDESLHGGDGSTYAEEAKAIALEISGFRAYLVEHDSP